VSKKLDSQESNNRLVNLEEAGKGYFDKGWRECSMSYVLLGVSKIAFKPLLSRRRPLSKGLCFQLTDM
jgi:hypothetical protein